MVCGSEAGDLLGEDCVGYDNPCDNCLESVLVDPQEAEEVMIDLQQRYRTVPQVS
jgi:hypothetical protein